MKMELKPLNKAELTTLYYEEMVYDFPKSELKPLSGMLRLMDMGCYRPLLALLDGEKVGYVILWLPQTGEGALLEYLGILRGKRNRGLGGALLTKLKEAYPGMFGEVEAQDSPDPAENDLRRHRVGFYLRNGFRMLDYNCALFGVHFNCIYCGPETDDRKIEAAHRSVYANYFSPVHFERYIQLPLAPGEEVKPAPEWLEEAFSTPRIELGERTAETVALYFQKANNEAIRRTLPQKAMSIEEAVADFYVTQRPDAASFGRTILVDGHYVGDVWCYGIHQGDGPDAMVSYCVFEPRLWGIGVATRALTLFLSEAAEKYALKTVGAFVYADHPASIRVLEKNGFRLVEEFTEDGVVSRFYQFDIPQEKA